MVYFLPNKLPHLDALTFFGLAILFCHVLGELAHRVKFIPRISGYILAGIIIGPNLFNLIDNAIIYQMQFLIDIAIGLILFKIGRYLDLKWLLYDKGLLLTGIFEFCLTGLSVFLLMYFLGWSIINSILMAVIAANTSPAIMLLITRDLNAVGPITRRSLLITGFNNFLAMSILALIFPFIKAEKYSTDLLFLHSAYRFIGSIAFGVILFKIFEFFAHYIFIKNKQNQVILLVSVLIISMFFSKHLHLSSFLALITLGMLTRNIDSKHAILELDFGFITQIFFIPLFFIIGCYLNFSGFFQASLVVFAFISLRLISKLIVPLFFKRFSNITSFQAICIGGALTPLSITAFGIANELIDFSPKLNSQLVLTISSAFAFFGTLGPIVVQNILLKTKEAGWPIKH